MANFPLVGVQFRSLEERETFANLSPGDELTLVRDPGNAYDPNAIKVIRDAGAGDSGPIEHHIGFIAAQYARKIAPQMDADGSDSFPASFVTAVDRKSGIISCDFSVD